MKREYFSHPSAYIEKEACVGKGTKIWHFSHIMKGAKIGKNCKIGQNVVIHSSAILGDNVKVQNNISIYDGVVLENDVFCGPSVVFTNIKNPRSAYPRNSSKYYLKTLIKEGATIGANATIICGHTIGKYAFVGAGSVVTKDIPAYALVYGNPAVLRSWMCVCGEKLEFKVDKTKCQVCKKEYILEENKCKRVK